MSYLYMNYPVILAVLQVHIVIPLFIINAIFSCSSQYNLKTVKYDLTYMSPMYLTTSMVND